MKRLALVALAATLLSSGAGAALAEPWQGHDNGGHDNGGGHQNWNGGGHDNGNHQNWNGGGHNNPAPGGGNEHRNFQGGGGNPNFQGGDHNFRGNPNFQGNGGGNNVYRPNPNYQGGNNVYRGNPNYQGGDHRNFSGGGQNDHRNFDRGSNYEGRGDWHGGDEHRGDWRGGGNYAWRGPHANFGFHHWGYGAYIPRSFLIDSFFLSDFYDYGLGEPPYGCEWVQDGPNALLIDEYTGQVLQVVPDAFY
jgi:Ni/Co efflux regulator RcnB